MKLYPKNYVEPESKPKLAETPKPVADAVKAAVKAFVKTVPCEYYEILEHVEKTIGLADVVDIYALIEDVDREWHPEKYEVEAEPKVVK